jgi:hypothetical protein
MTTFRKGFFMAWRNLASGSDIGHTGAPMRLAMLVLLVGFAARADNLVTDPGAPFPGFIDMARSTAMGGAQAAVASSNDALLVNPAGLAQYHRLHFEIDGAYDPHFPAEGIIASIVDSVTTAPAATGLVFNRWGAGQPAGRGEGWYVGLGYATQVSSALYVGGLTKYIRFHTPDGLVARWAQDLGLLSRHGPFSWALVAQNLSTDNLPLFPRTGTIGVAWGSDASARAAFDYKIDFSDTNNVKQSGALGGEWLVEEGFVLRGGLRRDFTANAWWVSAGVAFLTTGGGLQFAWRRRVTGPFDQIFEGGITLFLE